MPERKALKTYEALCRFLSSYPDVTVTKDLKDTEIIRFEGYMKKQTAEAAAVT